VTESALEGRLAHEPSGATLTRTRPGCLAPSLAVEHKRITQDKDTRVMTETRPATGEQPRDQAGSDREEQQRRLDQTLALTQELFEAPTVTSARFLASEHPSKGKSILAQAEETRIPS
jgi:hypothetical protein